MFAGTVGLLGALGLGRFSLGVMLPALGQGLDLSYGQMGIISTANFCGYLVAVLGCGFLNRHLGSRILIFIGLLIIGMSMLMIGLVASFASVLFLYSLTGIGSALVNIPIMGLITIWFEPALRGRAAGLCIMGNGIGILISGKAVPVMNLLGAGWKLSWLVLGVVVLVIAFICLLLIRNAPGQQKRTDFSLLGRERLFENKEKDRIFHLCGGVYFLFGCTYVIYVTFIVTSLIEDRGFSEFNAGSLWAWGGLLSILSGPLFGYISDHIGRKRCLMIVFSLQAVAYLLASWTGSSLSVYISVFCFSLVAFSVPSIMAALVGDLAGPKRAAYMFGYVTFIFGIGQVAGPALAGMAAEYSGSFAISFMLSALLVVMAVGLSSLLPDLQKKS